MKKYIKPNTGIHDIELQNMIALSGNGDTQTESPNPEVIGEGNFADGKSSGFGSFWSDGDEEE